MQCLHLTQVQTFICIILNSLFHYFSTLGNRVEDFLMDKIERRRLARLSNLDYLGVDMVEAGNDLGPGTLYGYILNLLT